MVARERACLTRVRARGGPRGQHGARRRGPFRGALAMVTAAAGAPAPRALVAAAALCAAVVLQGCAPPAGAPQAADPGEAAAPAPVTASGFDYGAVKTAAEYLAADPGLAN